MKKYIKTIEVLASRVICLEKELEEQKRLRDVCQELKKKHEPENK